ncbi:MAG: hypothetical protein K2J74_03085 [Muribaculaceae bacterium]|nr:hypothetical protein [Muribaculaceae bacterium]
MFKEIIKSKAHAIVLVVSAATLFVSCGSGNPQAKELLSQANTAYQSQQYTQAVTLLDSLKKTYPTDVEVQKSAMYLRTLADEEIILNQIQSNDSALAASEQALASLVAGFTFIKDADMVEGYTVSNSTKSNPLVNRTGLEARIDEYLNLYLVSLLNGNKANHDRVEVVNGVEFASTEAVPYNGSSNYRFNAGGVNNEMVTFRGGKADTLCMFIADNRNAKLKLNFMGGKKVTLPLSSADAKAIASTYEYARALQANREANNQKKYLDAKLQITRQQKEKLSKYATN